MSKKQNNQEENKALHIGVVTKRLNWIFQEMEKENPFSQKFNNLNERYAKLIKAKETLEKEGIFI